MNRWTIFLIGAGLILACTAAHAQAIKVVKKPAPALGPDDYVVYDHWVSSWGLRDDPPDVYSLGVAGHPTVDAATAAAKAHMARTAGNGALAVTHYLIEGEPSIRSRKGPSLPDDKRAETDALSKLDKDAKESVFKVLKGDLENLFRKKNQDVKDAYRRAKVAKEFVVRNVDRIAEDDFNRVNGLINSYNSMKDQYASDELNPTYFAALPRMTPVSAESLKGLREKWKASQESRNTLEDEKIALDAEQQRLKIERERLLKESADLQNEQNLIAALERAPVEDTNPLEGPFTLYTGQFSNTRGSKQGEYPSFTEARSLGEQHMSTNSTKQPNYRIADKNGNDVEFDGLSGQKKVSNARIEQSRRKERPVDTGTSLSSRKANFANRQQNRVTTLSDYKADLGKYQQRLSDYRQKLKTHESSLQKWKDDQYVGFRE